MLLGERDRELQEVERLRKLAAEASMNMEVDGMENDSKKKGERSGGATPLYCCTPPSDIGATPR